MRELSQHGDAVEGVLRKVLEGRPSLSVRQRVKLLLAKLTGAERVQKLCAIELLETPGYPRIATSTGNTGRWFSRCSLD